MLRSMTAYGRAHLETRIGHFVVEIQSVNRKFLEVIIMTPKELSRFDIEIKKWLVPHVTRGQINVKITVNFEGAIPFLIHPDLSLARQLKAAWLEIAREVGVSEEEFSLSLLSGETGLLKCEENVQEEESYRNLLKEVFDLALGKFVDIKVQEGAILQADITERVQKIRRLIQFIEQRVPGATLKYRNKLMDRLKELLPSHTENEERILREVALFAEKIDIVEEVTRFAFHVSHLEELIQSPVPSVGKTLEFILQELNREVNTIGSKSSDIEIARCVIEIKSELERIREQIQNVE